MTASPGPLRFSLPLALTICAAPLAAAWLAGVSLRKPPGLFILLTLITAALWAAVWRGWRIFAHESEGRRLYGALLGGRERGLALTLFFAFVAMGAASGPEGRDMGPALGVMAVGWLLTAFGPRPLAREIPPEAPPYGESPQA